jgi:hypothetical protein
MREAEQKALTTYGWVDQAKGTVRIPIEQAKLLVLRQGLPVRTSTAAAATTSAPTAATTPASTTTAPAAATPTTTGGHP